ncbi:hypothetical protein BS47DRAFT_1350791 [Hydnum rufescens UP504]|uniref:Uncharacterized protein n=1 Tax=Hydnum rufescens UP504 TaxID=1448309 RepID=A0A9P6ALN4_9AGAM|nr:hypothetical protein BS47DRAFT_1350791 [Hydnum rufescens UP504]
MNLSPFLKLHMKKPGPTREESKLFSAENHENTRDNLRATAERARVNVLSALGADAINVKATDWANLGARSLLEAWIQIRRELRYPCEVGNGGLRGGMKDSPRRYMDGSEYRRVPTRGRESSQIETFHAGRHLPRVLHSQRLLSFVNVVKQTHTSVEWLLSALFLFTSLLVDAHTEIWGDIMVCEVLFVAEGIARVESFDAASIPFLR